MYSFLHPDPSVEFFHNLFLGFGVGLVFLYIFFLILAMTIPLMSVSNACIFTKANRPAWASIIPYYNSYVLFDFTMGKGWLGLVYCLLPILNLFHVGSLTIISLIAVIVLYIFMSVKLSYSFGKKVPFALGLIFLPFIFYPILGFGKSEYQTKE